MEQVRVNEFIAAQNDIYDQVCAELRAAQKRTHWMWFIFPQLAGLGSSVMARKYALVSLKEARDYLAHPVLGTRLRECTSLLLASADRDISRILEHPDDLKFRSCMTLFAAAAPDDRLFLGALEKYFGGLPDAATVELLQREEKPS